MSLCHRTISILFFLLHSALSQHRFSLTPVTVASNQAPTARADHLAVVVQAADSFLVIVHGGRDAFGVKSDTWTYVIANNEWFLLVPEVLAESFPPPPLWGAVGGYRFVDGIDDFPFLYVTMGKMENGSLTNGMWVMELKTYTWRQVELFGDIPSPRYGAAGSLERFLKPDGSARPMLIASHGYGEDGALSDSYKCSFDNRDPYKATWRRMRRSVGLYDPGGPHPVWMIGSSFTSGRDLVMFGGCYAGERSGGICPSRDAWLLRYAAEKVRNGTDDDMVVFEEETDTVSWEKLPAGPAPRLGGAMAQGLNAFKDAYVGQRDIAVLYSGSQENGELLADHVIRMDKFDGGEIDILSTSGRAWLREKVVYEGPEKMREMALARRRGATLSIVRSTVEEDSGVGMDEPNEFFLLFGGEFENGSFSNALLKLSFDPFLESELVEGRVTYLTRPSVHGVLMLVSWGFLMVIGTYISRYMKDENGRSRYVVIHVLVQVAALIIGWAGIGVAVYGRRKMGAWFAHAHIGLALIVLASLQPVVAAIGILVQLRSSPGISSSPVDRVKMELRLVPRLCKVYHGVMGLVILVLGAVNITLGLFLIVAPTIIWVQWIVYSCLIVFCALWLEIIGGRRKSPEQMQTRASSMNHGMSRRSSTLRRMARSFRGESTADILRSSRTTRTIGSLRDDEISVSRSLDEEIVESDIEIPHEEPSKRTDGLAVERPWDGPASSMELAHDVRLHRNPIDPMEERVGDVLESQNRIDLMLESRERKDSTSSSLHSFRERLDSGASSLYTYQDPDSY